VTSEQQLRPVRTVVHVTVCMALHNSGFLDCGRLKVVFQFGRHHLYVYMPFFHYQFLEQNAQRSERS